MIHQSSGPRRLLDHAAKRVIALITLTVISGGLALGLAGPTSASAAGSTADVVDAFIGQQMSKHRVPGLAVALIEDGNLSYAAGTGPP